MAKINTLYMILTLKQKYAWSKFNPILRLKCYRELQGGGGKPCGLAF